MTPEEWAGRVAVATGLTVSFSGPALRRVEGAIAAAIRAAVAGEREARKAEIANLRDAIEMEASRQAYRAGLGASEWEAFLWPEARPLFDTAAIRARGGGE